MSEAAPGRVKAPEPAQGGEPMRVALVGNPNTGKTTLFNTLSGLRHKTSNFPGTTQEARIGVLRGDDRDLHLIDLPGVYSIELEQAESALCRAVIEGRLTPHGEELGEPDAVCVVVDSTNLARNLVLAGEVLRRRIPTVIALNMIDLARRSGLKLSADVLAERLGCEVVPCCARTGEGRQAIEQAVRRAVVPNRTPPGRQDELERWAEEVAAEALAVGGEATHAQGPHPPRPTEAARRRTDRIDSLLVHPVSGTLTFALVATGLFWAIFSLAQYPMQWIELVFEHLGDLARAALPDGFLQDLLADGVVAGVAGVVVFVPQIALLFFLISLLEDTGYLARAAFLLDRLLRPFGLPGHAFVPLLSSHACAIPGIIATRAIPDRRERLATILVAPFMTCSARLPVYVLVTTVLFPGRPLLSALAFVGCYVLGIFAGLFTALLVRRTILKGAGRPLILELPTYKRPSLRTAALTAFDRAMVFLKKAGTIILAISIVLWWLSAFPKVEPPAEAAAMRAAAAAAEPHEAAELSARADALEQADAAARSFIGRIGRTAQPVFQPLGYDWKLTVGVLCSFAAREVFVTTMAVVVTGSEEGEGILTRLAEAKRDDGTTPIFTRATSWSLLVFFVLAMQCMSTLVITARESGSWRWSLLQLVWMTGLAYLLAMAVYQILRA